jgi:tetratricopeptide (TPR) repeat protein
MTRRQWVLILASMLLFFALFFVFSLKDQREKKENKTKDAVLDLAFDESNYIDSLKKIDANFNIIIDSLELIVDKASESTIKAGKLKELSAIWYNKKQVLASAMVAEKVAIIENKDNSWSLAGANYYESLKGESDESKRAYITQKSVSCFEKASALNNADLSHKVNIALCYTENPPKDNPMKGILLLRALNDKNPNNPLVLTNLGRLAIKTGQFDKAIERLTSVLKIDSNNPKANCLIAEAYRGINDIPKAMEYDKKCQQLLKKK